ncbi:hypothetical protein HYX06_03125 [Candidatus Woesearchaeota archaeon]|nr:hypothetical protein [Candidatus Woesearchaeota archaeon]
MPSKSQSATEFVILASFMFLVILGFFAVTSSRLLEAREESNRKIANDIVDFAYKEIELAVSLNDGYIRVFALPRKVNGADYSINITDNRELAASYLDNEYVRFLPPNVSGNIGKGLNEIKKIEGVVYINSTLGECSDSIDDDGDALIDESDPGCYLGCNYLNPDNFVQDADELDSCSCGNVAKCCVIGFGAHYSLFDSSCVTSKCMSACLPLPVLTLRGGSQNIIRFYDNGSAILRGSLFQNANPSATGDDEFIFKDSGGSTVAAVNLATGNMVIRGGLQENQQMSPPPSSSDFIVKNSEGDVVSYIDELGNLYLKGAITQNGDP